MARAKKGPVVRSGETIGKNPQITAKLLRTVGDRLQIRAKAWITVGEETFLAQGRIQLLEKIRELGSISAAARSIRMSYRRAWWHIETMNRLARKPLVETAVGGKGGGGARLTWEGEAAVRLYRELDGRARNFEELVSRELKGSS